MLQYYSASMYVCRFLCISSERKEQLENNGEWIDDSLGTRIPFDDVGELPPGVGVAEYRHLKTTCSSDADWLVILINRGQL